MSRRVVTRLTVQPALYAPGDVLARDLDRSPTAGMHHVVERDTTGGFLRYLATYVSAPAGAAIVEALEGFE